MTSYKFLAAAVMLTVRTAAPVLAQAVIQEPGAYAFYHPNADLGLGSIRPAADAMASAPLRDNGSIARLRMEATPRAVVARRPHSVRAD